MYCKNCGQQIQDTALFCNFCGQKQEAMINNDFDMDKTVSVFDEQPSGYVPPVPVVTEPVIQPPMPQSVSRPFEASNKDFDPDATVGVYGDMSLDVLQYNPVAEPVFEAPQYTPEPAPFVPQYNPVVEPVAEVLQYAPVEEPTVEAPARDVIEEPKYEAPQYIPEPMPYVPHYNSVPESVAEEPQYAPIEEPTVEAPARDVIEEPKYEAPQYIPEPVPYIPQNTPVQEQQPAVTQFTPAAPQYNPATVQNFDNNVKKEKKGFNLFKKFGKKENNQTANVPVQPIPPVVKPNYVEPAVQPVVAEGVKPAQTPVKAQITDKDIYDMAQNHAPFDLESQDAQQLFKEVLSKIVPAYKDGVKLETAMLSTAPADIKINIANSDTDTLLVALKALNYNLSVGCDPAVLGLVIQRIYKVLKGRLS